MIELQNGHTRALDILIDRWEMRIRSFVYRYTQDVSWTDELVQETFVKIYQNASKFDTSRKFSPWIFTIATNICRNLHRWKKRRVGLDQSIDDSDLPLNIEDTSAATPFVDAQKAEQEQQVRKAIMSLSEHYQTAVILHYYQGMSYEDIAEVLKCSVRGVETRLYRARKTLKQKLSAIPA